MGNSLHAYIYIIFIKQKNKHFSVGAHLHLLE